MRMDWITSYLRKDRVDWKKTCQNHSLCLLSLCSNSLSHRTATSRSPTLAELTPCIGNNAFDSTDDNNSGPKLKIPTSAEQHPPSPSAHPNLTLDLLYCFPCCTLCFLISSESRHPPSITCFSFLPDARGLHSVCALSSLAVN